MAAFKPGNIVPKSGQYVQIKPSGEIAKEVTCVKHEHFPPAPEPGSTYKMADPTKNKSGR